MAWKEENPVGERKTLVEAFMTGRYEMAELLAIFAVSRKTAYKYISRFKEFGVPGLEDMSRASHTHPNKVSEAVCEVLIATKHAHPRYGPLKVLQYLERTRPDLILPAASTIGSLFKREGLVRSRARRRPLVDQKRPRIGEITGPLQLINMDFKGQFRTCDGLYCDPLTVTDTYSHSVLLCKGMLSPNFVDTKKALEVCFREHGVPDAERSDNGEPFVSSRSLGGLSRLGIWFVRLGIVRHRSRPGCPQDNGLHERMHRTLKDETARPPGRNLADQQSRFDLFVPDYNHERPHQTLGGKTPGSLYKPALKTFPERLPKVEYDSYLEVRQVRTDGTIKWKGKHVYMGEAFVGEPIGLEETAHGIWSLRFGPLVIGILDEQSARIVGVNASVEKPVET